MREIQHGASLHICIFQGGKNQAIDGTSGVKKKSKESSHVSFIFKEWANKSADTVTLRWGDFFLTSEVTFFLEFYETNTLQSSSLYVQCRAGNDFLPCPWLWDLFINSQSWLMKLSQRLKNISDRISLSCHTICQVGTVSMWCEVTTDVRSLLLNHLLHSWASSIHSLCS